MRLNPLMMESCNYEGLFDLNLQVTVDFKTM